MTRLVRRSVDGSTLREAMRRVPAAVTVVTVGGDEPRGITIGSFTSVSLEPPLIVFNVQRKARMHDLVQGAERFAVHVLRDTQAHVSDHFADPDRFGPAQFEGMAIRTSADGLPVLDDALAVLTCSVEAVYPAGDHSLFVGRVHAIEFDPEGAPILYFDRRYRAVGLVVGERD